MVKDRKQIKRAELLFSPSLSNKLQCAIYLFKLLTVVPIIHSNAHRSTLSRGWGWEGRFLHMGPYGSYCRREGLYGVFSTSWVENCPSLHQACPPDVHGVQFLSTSVIMAHGQRRWSMAVQNIRMALDWGILSFINVGECSGLYHFSLMIGDTSTFFWGHSRVRTFPPKC